MVNGGRTEVVVFMQLKPGLVRFQDAQEEIANLLASLYRLFGPVNPEAEYLGIVGTENGEDLWLWVIELTPPDEEEGLEEPLTEDDLEELLKEEGGGS